MTKEDCASFLDLFRSNWTSASQGSKPYTLDINIFLCHELADARDWLGSLCCRFELVILYIVTTNQLPGCNLCAAR